MKSYSDYNNKELKVKFTTLVMGMEKKYWVQSSLKHLGCIDVYNLIPLLFIGEKRSYFPHLHVVKEAE